MRPTGFAFVAAAIALLGFAEPAAAQNFRAPQHTVDVPPLLYGPNAEFAPFNADAGMQVERDRDPRLLLDEHRKLDQTLATLQPQRKGVVDAYVVAIALDSDPVFAREAREAGKVLAQRYDAAGRTIVLAGSDGSGPSTLPNGSPEALATALARVAEVMDPKEDVLVLYTTSHGAPFGIAYHDGDQGYGAISPFRLARMLDSLGIERRMVILSACFAGVFLPALASDTTVVVTAASMERTSFGCRAQNDWTFFGDAFVNHALRKPQPLDRAFADADLMIRQWESGGKLVPSEPQLLVGAGAGAAWLNALESRVPKTASAPVGRPATDALTLK